MTAIADARYRAPLTRPVLRRTNADDFDRGMAAVARRCYKIPDLSEQEKTLLGEFARGESDEPRYRLKTLRAFARIAGRHKDLAVLEGLAEVVRAEGRRAASDSPESVADAFDVECPVPGLADPIQREFETNPNPITAARCRDALVRQLAGTRVALDAVQDWISEYNANADRALAG